ncbi:unnamed protein product [Soboliphyme baturini]|uniref:Apple domain-containing protein n=1 Tax=Soboliphyme baturini TaxID=241478 RepID=A0A183J9K8_9BILA|nr:unnamed protein product [Soboliphyme baturini]
MVLVIQLLFVVSLCVGSTNAVPSQEKETAAAGSKELSASLATAIVSRRSCDGEIRYKRYTGIRSKARVISITTTRDEDECLNQCYEMSHPCTSVNFYKTRRCELLFDDQLTCEYVRDNDVIVFSNIYCSSAEGKNSTSLFHVSSIGCIFLTLCFHGLDFHGIEEVYSKIITLLVSHESQQLNMSMDSNAEGQEYLLTNPVSCHSVRDDRRFESSAEERLTHTAGHGNYHCAKTVFTYAGRFWYILR